MNTESVENYLGTIYKYRNDAGEIKATVIAEKLKISNAAVTGMLKKLAVRKLVNYEPYRAVKFTARGEVIASNLVRRHRIWEIFLHQAVGLPWDKVHDEAERLEHHASDELINRLEEILNFPEFDPHGDPIPGKDGILPRQKNLTSLSMLSAGEKGTVARVNGANNDFLQYITALGIKLKTIIRVLEVRHFDKSLLIMVNRQRHSISSLAAENIFMVKQL